MKEEELDSATQKTMKKRQKKKRREKGNKFALRGLARIFLHACS